ncbi:DUF6361 family protein [Gordonia sp. UBA7599]|nr:DUF6361 family protein [Gordonia sp. UBA7599]
MREIVRMFSDTSTLDDLGIGQVRDGLADLLFPGTSTVHTRARYFLIVPWAFEKAAAKHTGTMITSKANDAERKIIEALRRAGPVKGMVGAQAGKALQTLPSSLYWSALQRYGILADARTLTWNIPLTAPDGFPRKVDGGLTLNRDEADWLKERILVSAPHSYLAYLLKDGLETDPADATAPWLHPALAEAPSGIQGAVEHARLFSLAINGAALIYNQLIAEKYDSLAEDGNSYTGRYTERLDTWATEMEANQDNFERWDLTSFWATVLQGRGGRPVAPGTQLFVESWFGTLRGSDPRAVVTDEKVRSSIAERERVNKGAQSRLQNDRQIINWGGASGAGRLVYRWPNVQTLLADIREGLADASS